MTTIITALEDAAAAVNPDAQQAVTEFLDYTEYLPADLMRSLTLIRQLDETFYSHSDTINDLTKTYGRLSSLPASTRPNARSLRHDISSNLDLALSSREAAYAEAARLHDLTDRHQQRLQSIIAKLHALPKPPLKDPTPDPERANLAKGARAGRKLESGLQRLTFKTPKAAISGYSTGSGMRRVTVPGEVLPPFDPDEPIASTEVSDRDSEPPSPPPRPMLKLTAPKPQKLKITTTASGEKIIREVRERVKYKKPTPPPPDAKIGSKDLPWLRLNEFEMYRLRKKMKKNHTWDPTKDMINRELVEKGRGMEQYLKAKAVAEKAGLPFEDADNAPRSVAPAVPTPTPANSTTPVVVVAAAKEEKKLKRSDSKKDKKPATVTTQPAALTPAQQTDQITQRFGMLSSTFKDLFKNAIQGFTGTTSQPATPKEVKPAKRKQPSTPSVDAERPIKLPRLTISTPLEGGSKATAPVSAGKISLKVSEPQVSSNSDEISRAPSVSAKQTSPPSSSRPSSRRRTPEVTKNATPTVPILRLSMPATSPKGAATAASGRPSRKKPGNVLQSSQDGGVAVSQSTRAKPQRGVKAQATKLEDPVEVTLPQVRTDVDGNQEVVDPNEERYCICDDVSWGEMILCELDDKCSSGVWFHLECVELAAIPGRTIKWYCPVDRKKMRRGEKSNGLYNGRDLL